MIKHVGSSLVLADRLPVRRSLSRGNHLLASHRLVKRLLARLLLAKLRRGLRLVAETAALLVRAMQLILVQLACVVIHPVIPDRDLLQGAHGLVAVDVVVSFDI